MAEGDENVIFHQAADGTIYAEKPNGDLILLANIDPALAALWEGVDIHALSDEDFDAAVATYNPTTAQPTEPEEPIEPEEPVVDGDVEMPERPEGWIGPWPPMKVVTGEDMFPKNVYDWGTIREAVTDAQGLVFLQASQYDSREDLLDAVDALGYTEDDIEIFRDPKTNRLDYSLISARDQTNRDREDMDWNNSVVDRDRQLADLDAAQGIRYDSPEAADASAVASMYQPGTYDIVPEVAANGALTGKWVISKKSEGTTYFYQKDAIAAMPPGNRLINRWLNTGKQVWGFELIPPVAPEEAVQGITYFTPQEAQANLPPGYQVKSLGALSDGQQIWGFELIPDAEDPVQGITYFTDAEARANLPPGYQVTSRFLTDGRQVFGFEPIPGEDPAGNWDQAILRAWETEGAAAALRIDRLRDEIERKQIGILDAISFVFQITKDPAKAKGLIQMIMALNETSIGGPDDPFADVDQRAAEGRMLTAKQQRERGEAFNFIMTGEAEPAVADALEPPPSVPFGDAEDVGGAAYGALTTSKTEKGVAVSAPPGAPGTGLDPQFQLDLSIMQASHLVGKAAADAERAAGGDEDSVSIEYQRARETEAARLQTEQGDQPTDPFRAPLTKAGQLDLTDVPQTTLDRFFGRPAEDPQAKADRELLKQRRFGFQDEQTFRAGRPSTPTEPGSSPGSVPFTEFGPLTFKDGRVFNEAGEDITEQRRAAAAAGRRQDKRRRQQAPPKPLADPFAELTQRVTDIVREGPEGGQRGHGLSVTSVI